jgi:glycosyltransferase involved in cell wall biosynthesis
MTLPKITIITVTLNASLLLKQTIESIINQTYSNIEYIIIDGASTDNTLDIIKKYKRYITYWISEPDEGIYDAMNKGLEKATGEWINFMNAGDSFSEIYTISKVFKLLKSETDIIVGNTNLINKNNITYIKALGLEGVFDEMFCCHQSMFVKSSIIKQLKFDTSFKIAADYDFSLKCYTLKKKFQFLDFAVANFIDGGLSEINIKQMRIEYLFIQSKYCNDIDLLFNNSTFNELISFSRDNNYYFAKILNKLYEQCENLNKNNKKILLYGYGNIGKIIYKKLKYNISGIVDKDFLNMSKEKLKIKNPEKINDINYDFILISVLGREKSIKKYLKTNFNVPDEKIKTFEL